MNKKSLFQKNVNFLKLIILLLLLSVIIFTVNVKLAGAAGNMIKEGSFETDINKYWGVWQNEDTSRTYEFYRAYDAPFGYGSYSAVIEAKGSPDEPFTALMIGNSASNNFTVSSGKKYYLSFYARATKNTEIIVFLETAGNYSAITEYSARTIDENWKKYIVGVTPTANAIAIPAIVYGNMPNGASLYLDGIQLLEANNVLNTPEVKGFIGDSKFLNISNISYYQTSDIAIELPYFNNLTGKSEMKKINPSKLASGGAYFTLEPQTFAGIGKVFINDNYIGSFNYNLQSKIESFNPGLIRIGEDTVINGNGFAPLASDNMYLIVNAVNSAGVVYQQWIKPETCDAGLSRLSFKFPAGVISGNMQIQTAFIKMDGVETVSKSNTLPYTLKPVITATEWSQKGYEHVGDKLVISGKGFGKNPRVNFYDASGAKIETKSAVIVSIGSMEKIEAVTTKKDNSFNITVVSEGVESDKNDALRYLAKPKIGSVSTVYSRTSFVGSDKIPAAKIGETVVFNGESLKPGSTEAYAEFQGVDKRIRVVLVSANFSGAGTKASVIVPAGAQNGYVNLEINGQDSNSLPMEIVPTIISTSPELVMPGGDIQITANGIGANVNLAKVIFKLNGADTEEVMPYAIDLRGTDAIVYAKAPLVMSNEGTKLSVQYDHWSDNGASVLNVRPRINSASINLDNKILSIRGYGFSINPKENVVTYKYADTAKTTISPKVRMLGVYPTEEGLEIRVQILDEYYYGWISVQVGEYASNEVNFGPTSVQSVARRIEYVESAGKVMGVLYISGYNFGTSGTVAVGNHTATEHYRSEFMIIAIIDQAYLWDGTVAITRN